MATANRPATLADLLRQLGGIPARRIVMQPVPGTATERDIIEVHAHTNYPYELIDGTVVQKAIGFDESRFSPVLASAMFDYLKAHDLGTALCCSVMLRLGPGMVRAPDAAFLSWERYPKNRRRRIVIPTVVPELVAEIFRRDNTSKEMNRKLGEYFEAGVQLVWYVDPSKRTVRVYTAVNRSTLLRETDTLDGGDVLPGFSLSIREWFADGLRVGPSQP